MAKRKYSGIGCGYLVMIAIVTCGLLLLNSFLVGVFLKHNQQNIEPLLGNIPFIHVVQAAHVFFPVVMILAQFWLFDYLVDISGRNREQRDSTSPTS